MTASSDDKHTLVVFELSLAVLITNYQVRLEDRRPAFEELDISVESIIIELSKKKKKCPKNIDFGFYLLLLLIIDYMYIYTFSQYNNYQFE